MSRRSSASGKTTNSRTSGPFHGFSKISVNLTETRKTKKMLQLELLEIQEQKLKLQLEMADEKETIDESIGENQEEIENNYEVESNHSNHSRSRTAQIKKWIDDNPMSRREEPIDTQKYLIRQAVNKDLPTFRGDPIEWPSFISQFNETTKICGFSPRENLSRLQKSLRGKAHDSVRYLLNFPEQLDKIIGVLERRFGRAELIIEEILEQIKDIPYVKEYDHEGLIELSNNVLNLVITIENLNCHGHLMNPQITKELINKLSPNLRLQWGKQINKSGKHSNLKDFSLWLEETAEAASVVVTKRKPEKKKVLASYEMSPNVKPSEKKSKCIFCGQITEHIIVNCHKFKNLSLAQRWDVVKTKKICFCCLRDNHQLKFCRFKKECGINGCKRFHNKLLHDDSTSTSGTGETMSATGPTSTVETSFTTVDREEKNYTTILKILPVRLIGPKGKIDTFALLDDASTVTLLDAEVSSNLGLQGVPKPLCLQWTNDLTTSFENSKQVSVQIAGQANYNKIYVLKNVRTMKNLNLAEQNIDVKMLEERWPYIKNVNLGNLCQAKPTILIGQDNWPFLISRNFIRRRFDEPVLSKTRLGWVLHGNIRTDSGPEITTNYCTPVVCNHTIEDNLTALVELSFKLERDGLNVKMDSKSEQEERALKILSETTKELGESIKELDQEKLTRELSRDGIEWHFNPPAAPHMGGAWERLIRSVKTSLKAVLKEKYPKEEVMRTLLVETENIINSRPLTRASEDPEDVTCLTPNHFLVGSSNGAPSQGNFETDDLNLRKQWRVSQALAEMFWKRWYKEYIPLLNEREKWTDSSKNTVIVNDVVLIIEKNVPRNEWRLGVVVKTFPGSDNVVRVVDVKTKNGVIKRSVHQLCKL